MFKKQAAIILLTIAYALLLGHNIIPHHHHYSEHDLAEHHQTHHQHQGNEHDNDLGHLFTHSIHPDDDFTLSSNQYIGKLFSIKLISVVAVLSNKFSFKDFDIPPLLFNPSAEQVIYILPHSLACALRGPPTC